MPTKKILIAEWMAVISLDEGGRRAHALGNAKWGETFGENAMGAFVEQTRDGGYIVLGTNFATDSGGNIWLIKLKGD